LKQIIIEIIICFLSWQILNSLIRSDYKAFLRWPEGMFPKITLWVYMVLFNSISFFVIEYAIGIFEQEHKKSHVKYYFKYNKNIFSRFKYIYKSIADEILLKIKKNFTWLVAFILMIESIVLINSHNTSYIYSIGIQLITGPNQDSFYLYLLYLNLIFFIINLTIDI